jgi:hypothetical protein
MPECVPVETVAGPGLVHRLGVGGLRQEVRLPAPSFGLGPGISFTVSTI